MNRGVAMKIVLDLSWMAAGDVLEVHIGEPKEIAITLFFSPWNDEE